MAHNLCLELVLGYTYPTLTLLVVARLLRGAIGEAIMLFASNTAEHATEASNEKTFILETF